MPVPGSNVARKLLLRIGDRNHPSRLIPAATP
jgi:hypothetical protein